MKSLLYTGASGFLGDNTIPRLQEFGYKIATLGRYQGDYICDISKTTPKLRETFTTVLHAAGKAHVVPKTEEEKESFFDINFQGTQNLCKGLEKSGVPKNFIFISTVAVYGVESGESFSEKTPLQGKTPYAESKRMAEEYLSGWCQENNVNLSILRPSLIAGINPTGNLGTMIKGIESGKYLRIGKGNTKKSVLMAIDIANLVPLLEGKEGIYNICDEYHPSFAELEDLIALQLGKHPVRHIPYGLAKIIAFIGNFLGNKAPINMSKLNKITQPLTFSNHKAMEELNWKPLDVLSHFEIK